MNGVKKHEQQRLHRRRCRGERIVSEQNFFGTKGIALQKVLKQINI